MIVILALGASIRTVNYKLYNAAVAAGVLIALDLPHPSNLGAEGERVLFTFIAGTMSVLLLRQRATRRGGTAVGSVEVVGVSHECVRHGGA